MFSLSVYTDKTYRSITNNISLHSEPRLFKALAAEGTKLLPKSVFLQVGCLNLQTEGRQVKHGLRGWQGSCVTVGVSEG